MKRMVATCLFLLFAAPAAHAQPNLLVNGGFENPPTSLVYFDGFDTSVEDDVSGWILFLGAADGSYVQVASDAAPGSGGTDADMGVGPFGGGLRTAPGSRPAVTPLAAYQATVTYDNYFFPANPSYFIDWFDAGGNLLSSSGGALTDPNGPNAFTPYTQLLSVSGSAPALAAKAGVRFDGGNGNYNGLTADNFTLSQIPEPASLLLSGLGAMALLGMARKRRVRRSVATMT